MLGHDDEEPDRVDALMNQVMCFKMEVFQELKARAMRDDVQLGQTANGGESLSLEHQSRCG